MKEKPLTKGKAFFRLDTSPEPIREREPKFSESTVDILYNRIYGQGQETSAVPAKFNVSKSQRLINLIRSVSKSGSKLRIKIVREKSDSKSASGRCILKGHGKPGTGRISAKKVSEAYRY